MAVSSVRAPLAAGLVVQVAAESGEDVAVLLLRLEAGAGGEHVAQVLRHAFVDPEEGALLHLGEVVLVEVEGAAILAVPGVGELVGEEVGFGELMGVVGEAFFAYAVVGGLAVLEAFATGYVGEREKEVVDVVVARVVGGSGLADEVVELGEKGGAQIGVFGRVGDDIDVVFGRDLRGEGELVEVFAGDDGGVFKLLDGGGGVVGSAAFGVLWVVAVGWSECGADAPACRDFDRGLNGDFFYGRVRGVEEELLPLEHGELLADAGGDDAVEVSVQSGDAVGHGDVELVEVFIVASPGKDFAVGGEDDAGDVVDGAGGAVVAGDPLRRGEGDGAGLDGNVDLSVVELARGVGEIGSDLDRGLLGCRRPGVPKVSRAKGRKRCGE